MCFHFAAQQWTRSDRAIVTDIKPWPRFKDKMIDSIDNYTCTDIPSNKDDKLHIFEIGNEIKDNLDTDPLNEYGSGITVYISQKYNTDDV